MRWSRLLLGAWVLSIASCTERSSPPDEESTPSKETTTPSEETPRTSPRAEAPEGWERVRPEALSETAAARLETARKAKKALGQMLMSELTAAIEGGDFARGVRVCKEAAPKISEKVAADQGLEIGRTSFKVRNPDNEPRAWAAPFVEARVNEEVVLTGPENAMAYLSPIEMAEVCTNCHGTADQIPEEVKSVLAEAYPEDEATGFAAGDLRGWFWVEARP